MVLTLYNHSTVCVTTDTPRRFKQPTAARLARAAVNTIYGISVDTVGPIHGDVSRTVDGRGLIVAVQQFGKGVLPLRTSRGFEALVNDVWVSVLVTSYSQSFVIIPNVPAAATKLRYAWYENPCGYGCFECAVYVAVEPLGNWSGEFGFLPLAPFMVEL